ncbi:uncharacterized protein LOC119568289 [Penaeus monodon]|uniref:uncharacterized protein LOC119568289 n=1 Tax=Penaeus monodon TaxID=6687 RepID=UPI0018A7733A|nr:uncharacterized protein LOC119568289 [Penaeus monodon]
MAQSFHAVLIAIWQSGTIPPDMLRDVVILLWKEKGDRWDSTRWHYTAQHTSATLFSRTSWAIMYCIFSAVFKPSGLPVSSIWLTLSSCVCLRFVRSSGSAKRGLDLGLGRGFSGSQAAKHLMGLAAANFAGGPGRRRRSPEDALPSVHHQDDNVMLYDHERAPIAAEAPADAAPAMVETTGTQSR